MLKAGQLEQVLVKMIKAELAKVKQGTTPMQRTYSKLAGVAVGVSVMTGKDGVTLLSECLDLVNIESVKGNAAAGAFLVRLLHNVEICTYAPQKMEGIDTAREITNYWTDFEILQNLNLANDDVRNMLQCWRDFWQDDKDTGFANIPEQYRAAATQGDFGGLIARKLAAAVQTNTTTEKTPQRAENEPTGQYAISNEGREVISQYFTPQFKGEKGGNNWLNCFIRDLTFVINKPKRKKEFAAVLLLALSNPATTDEARKMSVAAWFEIWRMAFGIEKLQYKENQLKPQNYENEYKYLKFGNL